MGKDRTTEDMIRILQEEVEIPQIVQKKTDAAFRQIRIEYFYVADCDLLSGFSFEFQNRYARNLLFQIINVSAW